MVWTLEPNCPLGLCSTRTIRQKPWITSEVLLFPVWLYCCVWRQKKKLFISFNVICQLLFDFMEPHSLLLVLFTLDLLLDAVGVLSLNSLPCSCTCYMLSIKRLQVINGAPLCKFFYFLAFSSLLSIEAILLFRRLNIGKKPFGHSSFCPPGKVCLVSSIIMLVRLRDTFLVTAIVWYH